MPRMPQSVDRGARAGGGVGLPHRNAFAPDTMPGGMNTNHVDADTLEAYALGRLEEPERARVEEHLLTCQRCRKRLIQAEGYVQAMREALGRLGE